ncbi:MAG: aa3-type cytochrome c oxidase subunit IV [Rhodomicrobium sp.]
MNIDLADANENMDMAAHVQTYRHFVTLLKYSAGGILLLLICMAIFLT